MKQSLYKRIVLDLLSKMKRGKLTLIDTDNKKLVFGDTDETIAHIKINDPTFYKQVVLYGDIGFGESYMNKSWETDDLTKVISFFIANIENLPSMSGARKKFNPINLLKAINRLGHYLKPNSIKGSQRNIAKHYDLNNDFFKLFLDPSMTYSGALFTDKNETLNDAQMNKYESLCQAVKLSKRDSVLEIGCGWGGFAIYAASKYGCKVTGITISREQFEYASARVKNERLEDKIKIVFEDYRNVAGKYSKVISIEMIEAVGHKYFRSFFKKINQVLTSEGVLGLQAIIIPDNRYEEYRKSVDWLQKHIFPGGLLPSIAKINESVNQTGNMNMYSLKEMGLSYAKTLHEWIDNFNQNVAAIKSIGFDETFLRKWNFYLSSCEASFQQRNINVVQLVYARPNNPDF